MRGDVGSLESWSMVELIGVKPGHCIGDAGICHECSSGGLRWLEVLVIVCGSFGGLLKRVLIMAVLMM